MIGYYMPSSSSEGDAFVAKWCMNCACDNQYQSDVIIVEHGIIQCDILDASMMQNHVEQWIYEEIGNPPVCTAFIEHDWEQGAPPPPVDPNQLNMFDNDN